MAHIQTELLKLWRPQDLSIDKISSQKMFIDNIEALEKFGKDTNKSLEGKANIIDGEIPTASYRRLTGFAILQDIDLNTVKYTGQYGVMHTCTNRPDNATYGIMEVLMYSSHWMIQKYYSLDSTGKITGTYYRTYYSDSAWTSWTKYNLDGSSNSSGTGGTVTSGGTIASSNADFAEVGEWADNNTSGEDRIGYFVTIDTTTSGITMRKAKSTDDVRGVTVSSPAFAGNASEDKYNEDGALYDKYDYVAIIGLVVVRDNGQCVVNNRCMSNDDGIAVPSDNNMGYQVIQRISSDHILIAMEPGADMFNRIKTDINNKQDKIFGKDENGYYLL